MTLSVIFSGKNLCSFLIDPVSSEQRLIRKSLQNCAYLKTWLKSVSWQQILSNAVMQLQTSWHNVINSQRITLKPKILQCTMVLIFVTVNYVVLVNELLFLLASVK